jgi:hypothetical protein
VALAGVGAVRDPVRAGLDVWVEGVECGRGVEYGADGGEWCGDARVFGVPGDLVQEEQEREGGVDGAGGRVSRIGRIQCVFDDVCQDGVVL